jgi:glycosyltransferase involved in cell wall biosynthesis
MKILQVTPAFVPSKFGGVKAVSYNLSKTLAKSGHEVTVYTTDADIGYSRLRGVRGVRNVDGIDVRYFRNLSNLLAWRHHLWLPLGMIKPMKKEIKTFDIIHIHDFRSIQNIIAHHYAKKHRIPYVLQAHGSVLPIFQKQGLKKIFDIFLGYRILRDASKVIALTKTEAEQYKERGVDEDKIEIVPNGIDLPEYENLPRRGEFKRKYSIRNDEKMILCLGRIHKIKGIDLLVKAFADLSEELNNVKLVIIGPDDGFLSTLKGQIEDLKISAKILFTGPLYGRDKLEAYADADVYVLPSVYETFPVTVLEACACGTPIIVTDRCGIADFVEKVGCVVEYDKDQLRDAICKILSDEGLRRRFGKEGKKLVREKFGWDNIVEKVEKVYLGLAE